jgi:hypothetical protein
MKAFDFEKWRKGTKLLFTSFGDEDSQHNLHFYNIYWKRGSFYYFSWRAGVLEQTKPTRFYPNWRQMFDPDWDGA